MNKKKRNFYYELKKAWRILSKWRGFLTSLVLPWLCFQPSFQWLHYRKHSIQLVQTALKPDLMQQILALLCLSNYYWVCRNSNILSLRLFYFAKIEDSIWAMQQQFNTDCRNLCLGYYICFACFMDYCCRVLIKNENKRRWRKL